MSPEAEFDKFSESYIEELNDSVGEAEYFALYKAEILEELASVREGTNILDFGCGVGMLLGQLSPRFPQAELFGIDRSERSLDCMRPELKARVQLATSLDDFEGYFQVVVIANVLHHVPPSERAALMRKIASRLAPGGRIFIFEHNMWNPATRWVVANCAFDEDAILLPAKESRELLSGAGLSRVETRYIVFFPPFLKALRPLERWLRWLPLGAQYLVSARKD